MKTMLVERRSEVQKRNLRRSRSLILQGKELVWAPRRRWWDFIRYGNGSERWTDSYIPIRSRPHRLAAVLSRDSGICWAVAKGTQLGAKCRASWGRGLGRWGCNLLIYFKYSLSYLCIQNFNTLLFTNMEADDQREYMRCLLMFTHISCKKTSFNAELQSQYYTTLYYTTLDSLFLEFTDG